MDLSEEVIKIRHNMEYHLCFEQKLSIEFKDAIREHDMLIHSIKYSTRRNRSDAYFEFNQMNIKYMFTLND